MIRCDCQQDDTSSERCEGEELELTAERRRRFVVVSISGGHCKKGDIIIVGGKFVEGQKKRELEILLLFVLKGNAKIRKEKKIERESRGCIQLG